MILVDPIRQYTHSTAPRGGGDGLLSALRLGETASVCTTTNRRAAKEHSCDECGERIARGDAYEHVKGLWDSSWSTYRTCLSCAEIRSHFGCDGWTFGSLWEDLGVELLPDMTCGGSYSRGSAARMQLIEKRMAWLYDGGNATWAQVRSSR